MWVLHILLTAMFVFQGVSKLLSSPGWVSRFRAWGYPDNFYLVIGVIGVVSAVLLLIPKLAGFGSLILIIVMVGATFTHLIHGEPQVITALILMALLGVVVYIRRSSFTQFRTKFRKLNS
jgi:uncharacterized membrane protein YphA (DoxX/SURF4 family)